MIIFWHKSKPSYTVVQFVWICSAKQISLLSFFLFHQSTREFWSLAKKHGKWCNISNYKGIQEIHFVNSLCVIIQLIYCKYSHYSLEILLDNFCSFSQNQDIWYSEQVFLIWLVLIIKYIYKRQNVFTCWVRIS